MQNTEHSDNEQFHWTSPYSHKIMSLDATKDELQVNHFHLLDQLNELSFASNLDISSEPYWRDAEPKLAINSILGNHTNMSNDFVH